mgnify:CR=1 FL=1
MGKLWFFVTATNISEKCRVSQQMTENRLEKAPGFYRKKVGKRENGRWIKKTTFFQHSAKIDAAAAGESWNFNLKKH